MKDVKDVKDLVHLMLTKFLKNESTTYRKNVHNVHILHATFL